MTAKPPQLSRAAIEIEGYIISLVDMHAKSMMGSLPGDEAARVLLHVRDRVDELMEQIEPKEKR